MAMPKSGLSPAKDVQRVSARVYHPDKEMSGRDRRLMAEVVVSRQYLLSDLVHSPRCSQAYRRALMSQMALDAKLYALTVKACRQLFMNMVQNYRRGDFTDYVHRFKPGVDGIYYKWMLTPLQFFESELETDLAILTATNQWVSYDTKLNLRDLDYSTELSVEYLDDEYAMSRFTYDRDLISSLNAILREWCSGMSTVPETASWHFRHGNGATAELPRSLASPLLKCQYFNASRDDVLYLRWRGSVEGLGSDDLLLNPRYTEERPIMVDFVPKNPLTNRVISPEHVTKMWLQNDLAWLMDRMFKECHINIHLHDQGRSRLLALRGSVDGRYDTFDFSKASDFVTLELVSQVTQSTWLHDPLLWSRSKTAIVGVGSKRHAGLDHPVEITLHKFAPMGSSACFPTESLIFALLCELAVRLSLGRRSSSHDYVVYGDDCVIRSDCSDCFRFLASLAHLKVNDEKTCRYKSTHCFREACGIEALDGKDVTPLRISRRFVGCSTVAYDKAVTPGEAIGVCDLVNRCHAYGFRNLRKYFCSILRHWSKYGEILRIDATDLDRLQELWDRGIEPYKGLPLPYFVTDDCTATNYRCETRNRKRYNRREVRVWCVRTEPSEFKSPENYPEEAYFLWLLQALRRDGSDRNVLDDRLCAERCTTSGGPLRWVRQWVIL